MSFSYFVIYKSYVLHVNPVTFLGVVSFTLFELIHVLYAIFCLRPLEKTGHIMGTPAAGGWQRPQGVRSLSQRVFIQCLSNLVNMLVGIISVQSYITCQIPLWTLELWPLNCHYHWIYHKGVFCVSLAFLFNKIVITIEFTTKAYFVSVWLSCLISKSSFEDDVCNCLMQNFFCN